MSETLAEAVSKLAKSHADEWHSGPRRGSEDVQVSWLSIAEALSGTLTIGLSADGSWVRGDGATIDVADGVNSITLLPCLEMQAKELSVALRNGLEQRGASPDLADTFPINDVVLCGLQSHSEHWITLAMDRINENLQDDRFSATLRQLVENAPTQKLRHRARSLLNAQRN